MKRAGLTFALVAALVAAPASAQEHAEVTLTTPDGVQHACQEDFPGASYEAQLVARGYTERYEAIGMTNGQTFLNVTLLCQPIEPETP